MSALHLRSAACRAAWATLTACASIAAAQERATADPRIAEALARFEKARIEARADDAARLDALLFDIGTLPDLDPAALFAAWSRARGEARAALALALLTCADASSLEALIDVVADGETRLDHAYAHLIACARILAVETSLPSLRDLEAPGYRARVAEDLRRLHAASRAGVAPARTAELLELCSRIGASATIDPAATRALLEQATLVCGRLDPARALEVVRAARASAEPAVRQALWLALAFACNRSFLPPEAAAVAPLELNAEQLAGALERCEAFLRESASEPPSAWIAGGFAEAGFELDGEGDGPERVLALLEAARSPAPFVRFHAMRELAALSGVRPDLDLVFFPDRARAHPCAVVLTPAAREKRLLAAVRSWAEARHPELRK